MIRTRNAEMPRTRRLRRRVPSAGAFYGSAESQDGVVLFVVHPAIHSGRTRPRVYAVLALGAISVLLNTIAIWCCPHGRATKSAAEGGSARFRRRQRVASGVGMIGWAPMSRSQSVSKVCAPTAQSVRRCGPCRRRISVRQLMVGAPGEEPCLHIFVFDVMVPTSLGGRLGELSQQSSW